ncbi:hypothetical protein [Clostridium intestinale]|uniref:Uncharacterized protein n=1 Tax=Clostridium intestinale DSM 6191 TaxID=1121320 RepID=A0A1M5Y0M4_9CLOT|nr:hypothetical protein [Clostridium intestinale]SHI05542.1 hypothetical protein SAMN02745941_01769 [Clostridium intestinale DSM 6191]
MPILIILAGVLLIYFNYKGLKKEDKSFLSILQNEEENISDTDLEIGKLRREFSETILELQKEIIELKEVKQYNYPKDNSYQLEDNTNDENYTKIDTLIDDEIDIVEEENETENQVISRMNVIKDLIDKGYTDEDICESLSMGKGEVLLIKSLLKQSKI